MVAKTQANADAYTQWAEPAQASESWSIIADWLFGGRGGLKEQSVQAEGE